MIVEMCLRLDLAPSSAYRYYKCRCERCIGWKREAANRTTNKELAILRSREWRKKNLKRSRENSRRYQREHPEKVLEWSLKKYGLSIEEYEKMGDRCHICGLSQHGMTNGKARLSVDHDKTTGRVRGLLCGNCNVGLGHFNHSEKILQGAIAYLKENGDVYAYYPVA